MHRFRSTRNTFSSNREEDKYTAYSERSVSPLKSEDSEAGHKPQIAPASSVPEVSKTKDIAPSMIEASDDLYGLTPVQSKHKVYEIEHRRPHGATMETKRSSISVRKFASRWGSRLTSKDTKATTEGKVLQKSRPAVSSIAEVSPYASTSAGSSNGRSKVSLLPPQMNGDPQPSGTYRVQATNGSLHTNGSHKVNGAHGSNRSRSSKRSQDASKTASSSHEDAAPSKSKPHPDTPMAHPPDFGLPPELGASADHHLAKLLPPIQDSTNLANIIDKKLTSMHDQASRPTLKDELEATQQRLSQLFVSQALLRERYNSERDKSIKLDDEHLTTHTRIHSLEQSTREMNDELRRLHEYVGSLELANKELRGSARAPNEGTLYAPQIDLGSVPSTRPTSASPPMSEIQPLRPHPPPIPKKADGRSLKSGEDGSPVSRTNSQEANTATEDISYWRVGDITMIAEAGPGSGSGTPRPFKDYRRSTSMSDDMLRRANLNQIPASQASLPTRSHSVQPMDPMSSKAPPAASNDSAKFTRPEVRGFPQTSYAPVVPSPLGSYSAYETSALGTSIHELTPVPTQTTSDHKPSEYGMSHQASTASRTTNGYGHTAEQRESPQRSASNGHSTAPIAPYWPEYVENDPTINLRRQSTIKARPPPPIATHRALTYPNQLDEGLTRRRSPPSQTSLYSADHVSGPGDYDERNISRPPSHGATQTTSSSSGSRSHHRRLKLKSSLELLPNCAKKEVTLDASRQAAIIGKPISPTSNFIQKRGFALYRFVNPKPSGRDMITYELERLKPSMSTSKVMTSEPTTLRVVFPRAMKGVEGTVGMYDSVSEMWLNPHALKKKR